MRVFAFEIHLLKTQLFSGITSWHQKCPRCVRIATWSLENIGLGLWYQDYGEEQKPGYLLSFTSDHS